MKKTINQKAKFFIYHDTPIRTENENLFDEDEDGNILILNCRHEGCEAVHYLDEDGVERVKLEDSPARQVADDFDSIVLNRCRHCKQYNKKRYETLYWKKSSSQGSTSKTLYCFDNGYCESCAKKLAVVINGKRPPREVYKTSQCLVGDQVPTVITEYDDGSIYEEYPYGMPPYIEKEKSVFRHL